MNPIDAMIMVVAFMCGLPLGLAAVEIHEWFINRKRDQKIKAGRIWRRLNYGPGWGWMK